MTCCPGTGPRQPPLQLDHVSGMDAYVWGKRPFLTHLQRGAEVAICSRRQFSAEENEMADETQSRAHYGEAFWRAHHEAWRRSDLNQRQYCEAQGISLKAFGNWRAKFKVEPQPLARKLLYRRGGLSHTLSHSLGHPLSHMTYASSPRPDVVVLPAREGHRRRFSGIILQVICESPRESASQRVGIRCHPAASGARSIYL